MLNRYNISDDSIDIKCDLASEFPIYIYLSDKKDCLLYSKSIKELLDNSKVKKPLEVTSKGISFLLQSGVVPLPNTVYKDIFIVGIGDTAIVKTINNKIEIEFSHNFPFFNKDRDKEAEVDDEYILEIIAEATISRIEKDKPTYLFHSAGKDSNMIALALAEANYQNNITCISYKSKRKTDESEISKQIATKLGFKHQKIHEINTLEKKHLDSINYYFENIPLPCVDEATLAYSLYPTQIKFQNTNIIDGSGNDVYMGHIPSKFEYNNQRRFSKFNYLRPITDKFDLGTRAELATATRSEWAGLSGITYRDTNKIFNDSFDVYKYWKREDIKRKEWDYLDLRADIWGTIAEFDRVIRKSRNLADINNANLILPFTNQKVANYFSKSPEKYLFNRKEFKNKLIFRDILKDKINLDSDKLGKLSYGFDFYDVLLMMEKEVNNEILSCKLWNKNEISKLLKIYNKKINNNHRYKEKFKSLIQRLYLISTWFNKNRYVSYE